MDRRYDAMQSCGDKWSSESVADTLLGLDSVLLACDARGSGRERAAADQVYRRRPQSEGNSVCSPLGFVGGGPLVLLARSGVEKVCLLPGFRVLGRVYGSAVRRAAVRVSDSHLRYSV